jgi:hypothetical protein
MALFRKLPTMQASRIFTRFHYPLASVRFSGSAIALEDLWGDIAVLP